MVESPDQELRKLHDDVARRQYVDKGPRRMADVLSTLMARRGYSELEASAERDEAWQAVVGERMSSHSRIGIIRGGVVEVIVGNSAALQELTFRKAELVREMSAALPHQKIRDMRFRVGGLR